MAIVLNGFGLAGTVAINGFIIAALMASEVALFQVDVSGNSEPLADDSESTAVTVSIAAPDICEIEKRSVPRPLLKRLIFSTRLSDPEMWMRNRLKCQLVSPDRSWVSVWISERDAHVLERAHIIRWSASMPSLREFRWNDSSHFQSE